MWLFVFKGNVPKYCFDGHRSGDETDSLGCIALIVAVYMVFGASAFFCCDIYAKSMGKEQGSFILTSANPLNLTNKITSRQHYEVHHYVPSPYSSCYWSFQTRHMWGERGKLLLPDFSSSGPSWGMEGKARPSRLRLGGVGERVRHPPPPPVDKHYLLNTFPHTMYGR